MTAQTQARSPIATPTGDSSTLLRYALRGNAAISIGGGLAMAIASPSLAALLGIPAIALLVTGLILVPYGLIMLYATFRPQLSRRFAWTIVILDLLWVLDSAIVLATGLLPLTTVGWWTTFILAAVYTDFVVVQYLGLRRMR